MKKSLLILFVLCLGYAASSQPIVWTNGTGDGLWETQANWDAGFSPDFPGDEGVFDGNVSSGNCTVVGTWTVGLLTAGVGGGDYEGTLTIQSGSSLTTTGPRWCGVGWTKKMTLVVESGATFSTASHLWLAFNPGAKSYIELYGTINVGQMFGVNFENKADGTSDALLNVRNGGVLNLAQLTGAGSSPNNSLNGTVADGSVVVYGGGTITLVGDRTGDFNTYISAGKIVTPGGTAVVTYDSVADLTSVTSTAAPLSNEKFSSFKYEVYPNPTDNLITVKSLKDVASMKLYNITGQLISQEENTSQLNISNLSSGYYILKAEDIEGNIGIKRIIKN